MPEKPKDNIITVPFTQEMLVQQCFNEAAKVTEQFENVVILARDKEGDLQMYHSFVDRAELIDAFEECKFAIYSGDFFDV